MVDAVLDVEVPSGGRRKPASRYKTSRVKEAGGVHVGEALPLSGAIRIVELQEARKDRLQRQSAPQRLFGVHETDKDDLTGDDLVRMRGEANPMWRTSWPGRSAASSSSIRILACANSRTTRSELCAMAWR